MFKSLIRLLNFLLETGIHTLIFKYGTKVDPGNYRGICVTSCLGKVFCSLLKNRFINRLHLHNPIHKSQTGFQGGTRTSDHIFTP